MKKFSLLAAIVYGIFPVYLIGVALRNAGWNPFRFRGRLRKSWADVWAIVEVCAVCGKKSTDPVQFPPTLGGLEGFIKLKLVELASKKLAFERMEFQETNEDEIKAIFRKLFDASLALGLLLYKNSKWYFDQAGELSRKFEKSLRRSRPEDFPTAPGFYSLGRDREGAEQDPGMIWVRQPVGIFRLETNDEKATRLKRQIVPQEIIADTEPEMPKVADKR